MKTILAALCAACLLGPVTAWANGDGDNHQNGSVHHNTVNNVTTTNEGDVTNQGGTGVGGTGGTGVGVGGNGGTASTNASVAVNSESETYGGSISLVLTGCQQGAGAYGGGFGASLGSESRVCQLLRVAAAHQALGMHYEAARLVRDAARELNGGAAVSEEAPLYLRASRFLGRVLRAIVEPLPFVGHAA